MIKFKKKKAEFSAKDRVEVRFQTIVNLIRDLDKKEFVRLQEGMSLAWQAYQKVGQAQSAEEKESYDIEKSEQYLEMEK